MTYPSSLATSDDVEAALVRPLTTSEAGYVYSWIDSASAQLRQRVPRIDDRMATWESNQSDPRGLDPTLVTAVIADVVKRFIGNAEGLANTTVTTGPYSVTKSYSSRSDSGPRGEVVVLDSDVAKLAPAGSGFPAGTIRTRPYRDDCFGDFGGEW